MDEAAIRVENLGKRFRLGVGAGGYDTLLQALARAVRPKSNDQRELWALRGVDMDVARGEVLGVIGPNGAGKSTLLRILARITVPTEGAAWTRGTVGALLDVGTGFDEELTGRENIFLNGTLLGMGRRKIRAHLDEIVEFAGVERFLDTPIKRYSDGMQLRLAFAVAAHLESPIVVIDEVLAVGDAVFREKCMGKMAEMGRRDRTVLFVSHDLGTVTRLCKRVVWLEAGRIRADGPARKIVSSYLTHVTPAGLLDVEFDVDPGAATAVQRVTVRDATSGQVLTVAQRGRAFTIEMAFVVREAIRDVDVSLVLIDELGAIIVDDAVNDRLTGAALSGEPGTYVVSATFPGVLRAGPYLLRTWIGNSLEEAVDRGLLTIRVAAREDDPQEFMERTRAVQPEIEWKARREPLL
ncbi:MAG: ATP-binding cassette domain-containing protein [Actinomycetia bacterium]|nr:ATP-binding cassette domain-containing protein [Actinomycetes bacterium]